MKCDGLGEREGLINYLEEMREDFMGKMAFELGTEGF